MDAAAARAARAGGGAAAAAPPDSDAARQERAAKVAARTGKSLVRAEDLHGDAGWGFGADAVDEGGGEDDSDLANADFERLYQTAKAKGVNMTARQGRLAEQLEKRSAKLSNLVEESDRIKAKEWEGLSEGQQAHKAKNAERVEALRQEIQSLQEQLAETLREQLGAKGALDLGGKSKAAAAADDDGGDDDDDFYDRTSKKAKGPRRGVPKPGGGVVESEASLRAKLAALDGREAALTKQLLALKREIAEAGRAAADSLDAFMEGNTAAVRESRVKEVARQQAELVTERAHLQRLLSVVARRAPAAAAPPPPRRPPPRRPPPPAPAMPPPPAPKAAGAAAAAAEVRR